MTSSIRKVIKPSACRIMTRSCSESTCAKNSSNVELRNNISLRYTHYLITLTLFRICMLLLDISWHDFFAIFFLSRWSLFLRKELQPSANETMNKFSFNLVTFWQINFSGPWQNLCHQLLTQVIWGRQKWLFALSKSNFSRQHYIECGLIAWCKTIRAILLQCHQVRYFCSHFPSEICSSYRWYTQRTSDVILLHPGQDVAG